LISPLKMSSEGLVSCRLKWFEKIPSGNKLVDKTISRFAQAA
jgi:hypothetical protein